MTAHELKTAATRLRDAANQSPAGPWTVELNRGGSYLTVISPETHRTKHRVIAQARAYTRHRNAIHYVALMHPGLGEALAAWLDAEAHRLTHGAVPEQHEYLGRCALAVAAVINGSEP